MKFLTKCILKFDSSLVSPLSIPLSLFSLYNAFSRRKEPDEKLSWANPNLSLSFLHNVVAAASLADD